MDTVGEILDSLAAEGNLRTLRTVSGGGAYIEYGGRKYVNLSSNDYLGIGGDLQMQRKFAERLAAQDRFLMSNPSSRLITGNSGDYDRLESRLESIYPGKSALVLGSGYLANTGILPAVVSPKDLVLADKLVHASLIDGVRLCGCEHGRFNHNDMNHLESLLSKKRASYDNVWVVTESVFSMDGDRAQLKSLVGLKHRYDLKLYVDEAHAFGVCGSAGGGCASAEGLDGEIDIIVGTFGKATASYGAFAAVEPQMRELLVNRMRTLIFTTALPPIVLQWTDMVIKRFPEMGNHRERLRRLSEIIAPGETDATHIIPLMVQGNAEAAAMAERFREEGFWVTPIRYPTVPRGKERIRISLNAALDIADVKRFKELWKSIG